MIVRILTQGQYRLGGAYWDELNALDNRIVGALAEDNEAEFRRLLSAMVRLVQQRGAEVPLTELVESDVVLPSADISPEEARKLFVGEGIIAG